MSKSDSKEYLYILKIINYFGNYFMNLSIIMYIFRRPKLCGLKSIPDSLDQVSETVLKESQKPS